MNNEACPCCGQNHQSSGCASTAGNPVERRVMPFQLTDTVSFDLNQAFSFEFRISSEKKTDFYVGTIKLWVTMRSGEKSCLDMGSVDCACGSVEQAKKEAKAKMNRINKKMQAAWAGSEA